MVTRTITYTMTQIPKETWRYTIQTCTVTH